MLKCTSAMSGLTEDSPRVIFLPSRLHDVCIVPVSLLFRLYFDEVDRFITAAHGCQRQGDKRTLRFLNTAAGFILKLHQSSCGHL